MASKTTWRYRRELVQYELFTCACENNAESDIYEGDVAAECIEQCFDEPEGIFALAIMNSIMGHTYCRHHDQIKAESAYELSIAISPDNSPCYLDYAQIQETCHDDYFKADQAYVKSVELHHNTLAMYNLASMHLRIFNDGEGDSIRLHKAIMYYGIACDHGDSGSSYMAALLLYKNYDYHNYPEKIEEFAYRLSRLAYNINGLNSANKSNISILPKIIAHIIIYFEKTVNSKYKSKGWIIAEKRGPLLQSAEILIIKALSNDIPTIVNKQNINKIVITNIIAKTQTFKIIELFKLMREVEILI